VTQIKHAAVGRLEASIGQQEIGVERVGPLIFLLQRVFFWGAEPRHGPTARR